MYQNIEKNKLINFTESDIVTNRLVLLPFDWDGKFFIFKKWLQRMNKLNSYLYARILMNGSEIDSKHKVREPTSAKINRTPPEVISFRTVDHN